MNGGLGRKFVVLVAVLLPVFLYGPVSRAEEQNFPGEAAIEKLLAESDEAEGKRREKLLLEAVERARKSAASIKEKVHSPRPGQAAREEAIVDWFSVRLRMADILGMRRGRPVIARMKLSLSTSEQRQKLCLWLSESLKELEEIQTDLKRRQKWAEDDSAREVNLAPRLERLGWQLRWQRAFARYWKARATAEGSERIRLLEKTIADVEKMVSAFSAGSPRQRLQLLKGSCLREKGKHKKAVRLLSQLAGQASSADLREKVFFELARARIDFAGSDSAWADADSPGTPAAFRQAVEAVAKYQALSPKPDPKTLIDVRAMMLHERFYSREIKREDADAERVRNRLDEALRDFLSRHRSPSSRALVAKLFLRRWSQKQINNAPPSVLVLLAAHRLSRGDSGGTSRPDSKQRHDLRRDLQKAIDLAERAKKQDRDGRNPIVPEALWIIGRAKAIQTKRLQATEAYEELSRNYPSHSRAKAAALERARIRDRMLESALAGGNTSVRKYRKAFVDALSVLATNWDEDDDADRWQLAIGAQCAVLAREADSDQQFKRWARRAVESYGQIKSQKYTGLMADFLALEQEYKLARRTPPSDREQAAELARRLQALSARLKNRTESDSDLTEPKKKQLADRACRCKLYALLLRHSVLGDEEALDKLSTLRERWSECDAGGAADCYLFEDALRNQRLKEAAESLRHFRQSYGMDKTKELADRFLGEVRSVLESGRDSSRNRKLLKIYYRWAGWLYNASRRSSPLSYRAGKFYADALTRRGNPADLRQAIKLYGRLEGTDREPGDSEESGSVDVKLVIGKARCLKKLGRLEDAIETLNPLCSGLSRESALFWTAQVERAECVVESGNAKALRKLLTLIRQLKEFDPDMGSPDVLARFAQLRASAEKKLKTAP